MTNFFIIFLASVLIEIYYDRGERRSALDSILTAIVISIILYTMLSAIFYSMEWFWEVVIPYYLGDFFSSFKEASDEIFKPQSGI